MTGPDSKGGSLDRLCYRFGADSFTWLGEYHSNQEVPARGLQHRSRHRLEPHPVYPD